MFKRKFKSRNDIFVTSLNKIRYTDVLRYLLPKLYRDELFYPRGTVFYVIVGIHHSSPETLGKSYSKLGKSDSTLTSQYHHSVLEGKKGKIIKERQLRR